MSVAAYYESLSKAYDPKSDTEHTHRSKLEALLNDTLKDLQLTKNYRVVHEGKRVGSFGTPDFRVLEKASEAPIGYVENKEIGTNMDAVLKSDQIKKYITLSGNLLVTDYLEFVLIQKDRPVRRERLAHASDLDNKRFTLAVERVAAVESLLSGFLRQEPEAVSDAKSLARALAVRSRSLHDMLENDLDDQLEGRIPKGRVAGLYETFKNNISAELTVSEFADAFAQTLAYGLFLARLNTEGKEKVSLENADQHIPQSMELIRELVEYLGELNKPQYKQTAGWIVKEILTILNRLDLGTLQATLSYRNRAARAELGFAEPDPYLYFYEDFLAAYDKTLRKAKGVYYTPPAVVNFIVRGINDILKDTFGIKEGLADRKRVTVLDFATGTGTFLFEVMRQILAQVGPAKKEAYIRDHILQNLYGFEYLIAPYTIAHLKLSQYLKEEGYEIGSQDAAERLRIYLTNTLEPLDTQMNAFVPALSKEGREAQAVKQKPILVITGNPPYSGHSTNKGSWITSKINDYKKIEGKPLGEKNLKWLQDDYVKFIRFAQDKMDQVEEGVVGIITNHSFLDNPTFRGMRYSLMQSFDQIYVVDLHGNAKKKEKAPDGSKDENVFDIEQGVAISFFVKKKGIDKGIWRTDFWGSRKSKYMTALSASNGVLNWNRINASLPEVLFTDMNNINYEEYHQSLRIQDIFRMSNVGIVTARDALTIQNSKEEAYQTAKDFASIEPEIARIKYKLGEDARDWKVKLAQADVRSSGPSMDMVHPISYRPYDKRYTLYTGHSKGYHCMPRAEIMQHMLKGNIALSAMRGSGSYVDLPVLISNSIIDQCYAANKSAGAGITYLYPLYLYQKQEGLFAGGEEKVENFTKEFRKKVDALYGRRTPENLLGYIYAVLHSPSYREKYRDFLKSDFPRIPFTEDVAEFERLSDLGRTLYETHLMQRDTPPAYDSLGIYTAHQGDTPTVDKPSYAAPTPAQPTGRLYVNLGGPYFDNVPETVYQFHIGGYQVLAKYLKDRKGRTLSLDEIENIEKVVKILAYTRDAMNEIG